MFELIESFVLLERKNTFSPAFGVVHTSPIEVGNSEIFTDC